jgi:hypothetical protein
MDRDPSSAWKMMRKGLVHGYNYNICPIVLIQSIHFGNFVWTKIGDRPRFLGGLPANLYLLFKVKNT